MSGQARANASWVAPALLQQPEVAAAVLQLGVGCLQGEGKGVGARWVHLVCLIHQGKMCSLLIHRLVVDVGPAASSCVS